MLWRNTLAYLLAKSVTKKKKSFMVFPPKGFEEASASSSCSIRKSGKKD
jgi:hypothetical protein